MALLDLTQTLQVLIMMLSFEAGGWIYHEWKWHCIAKQNEKAKYEDS